MDNKAYEKYQATQPVTPRAEPEPMPTLTMVEITVIAVFAIAVIYAVYRMCKN